MLKTALTNKLASAKRGKKERSGIHSWHPYYAGYSEDFVASAINYLDVSEKSIILDPWNGSGTTGFIASRLGRQSIGCEINPVINIFASAKNIYLTSQKKKIEKLLEIVKRNCLEKRADISNEDPLLQFMSKSLCQHVRAIYWSINNVHYPACSFLDSLFETLNTNQSALNPFQSFFTAALFITSRQLAGYKGGSNPTWVKTLKEKPEYPFDQVLSGFESNIYSMLKDLEVIRVPGKTLISHLPVGANSKKLPLRNLSIDAVITSPPYLTRIDYAMSTKPELLMISDPQNLRLIREKTIGAPVIIDKNILPNDRWGKTCRSLLNCVEQHSSKAAKSYYLPNMLQYFRDIELSINEIYRVLKKDGRALVVVQSSYFKEHEIDLGQIYIEMGENLGFKSTIANREIVRGHMAHVNTKSNQYKAGKVYYEDAILYSK